MDARSRNEAGRTGFPEGTNCGGVHHASGKAPEVKQPEVPRVSDNPIELSGLGRSRLIQFRGTGSLSDLNEAIAYFARALALTPNGHPDMSRRHAELGVSYNDRYRRLGQLADLEKAIECDTHALVLTPDGHPDMPGRHASLGTSYSDRYRRLGELKDLKKAIECKARALALTPDGHPDISRRHASLGVSYVDQYRRLDELADLEKAIECHAHALALTSNGHPSISLRHSELGVAYSDRYRRLGELVDLEKTIEYFTRALELTPNNHPDMSHRHASLGAPYIDRYRRLGQLVDLEKAIECFTRALALTPDGHPDMSRRHATLGVAYTDRYRSLGELADLNKAMECDTHALALTPNGHPDLSERHASLGASYSDRYRRQGELTDLEKAIECKASALALTPDGHPDMSHRHASLGVSYSDRYRLLGELADLKKAIEWHTRALALTPDGHPDIPRRHAELGVSFTDRYNRLDELADLEKAIECFTRVALTPGGHPDMSRRHTGLGSSYADRYRRLGGLADLEKAIECFTCAIALTPDGHPDMSGRQASLGVSYSDRYRRLNEFSDLEKAIECNTRALALTPDGHPHLPSRHDNYAVSLLHQYNHTGNHVCLTSSLHSFRIASQHFSGAPRDKFQHALRWARHAINQNFLDPIEAYQTSIDLLPQFIWLGATTNQRYQDLLLTDNLAVNACFAAIQSSNYSLALEWLEHARCVVWNQSMMLRSPLDQLHSSHPDIATRLQSISRQLHSHGFETQPALPTASDSMTPEQVGQQRRHLASEYHDLLTHTRQLPGFASFLQPSKAHRLICAVRNGPVVILNCHPDSCNALVIMPGQDQVTHLPLPNFSEQKARKARSELDSSLGKKGLRQRGVKPMYQTDYKDSFESVLRTVWNTIVQPVLSHLGFLDDTPRHHLPHITWCPTGLLTFLPLHAAGDYSQPQSRIYNYAISSYIPTLTSLLASTPTQLIRRCKVLAIGQATTPGQNPLPGTTKELALVKTHTHNIVDYSQLMDSQATTTAVLDAMEQHDWVHLACHANQNVRDPIKSGFHLYDGTLDLSAINRRSFKNKGLAFLSACQTATGDENLPDEAIHLASGMLMAGYPSVIATMWSVDDRDAPFVADKVYAQLMKDGTLGNGEAGRALHYAVAGLREKVGEKEFGRWVPYIHVGL
ncbi:aromatic di-alanine and TPR containing protein [Rhizoctonia solani 123E]|uniref:Aromatic di-alanine and TPR containing protein n=1 Tax=Rhizoctonia solani 123E TaxID=1423351 RepID=A0A074SBV7_9AGAM|nr:aromatic di-alanine and TPR containing protein [Rhizoctonia solani 123E]